MAILEYVTKFTELARFGDDYVAKNVAKVRKFEDGLKLFIRGKIVGFLLQDMNSIVRTSMAIEREIEDAQSIRDAGASDTRNEDQPSSSSGKDFYSTRISRTGPRLSEPRPYQGSWPARTDDMFPLPLAWTYEVRFPAKVRIPGFWSGAVPVISGTSADTVCSLSPQCGQEEPASVSGCCTEAFCYTKRPWYGSRKRTELTGQDFRDLRACLLVGIVD